MGIRIIPRSKVLRLDRLLAKQVVDKMERRALSLKKANIILVVSKNMKN